MKKYQGCPNDCEVLEEHSLYVKVFKPTPAATGGSDSLIVPAQFWPRFIFDKEWREDLFATYAKRIYTEKYPKKDFYFAGRLVRGEEAKYESMPSIVPNDTPFAITKLPHCPTTYFKNDEDDSGVVLDHPYIDGFDGGTLKVLAELWDRFVTDQRWRGRMMRKYTRMHELDTKSKAEILEKYSEEELYKTGVIPEDELDS